MSESTIRKAPKGVIDTSSKDTITLLTEDAQDNPNLEQVLSSSQQIIEQATVVKESELLPPEQLLEDLRSVQLLLKNSKNKNNFYVTDSMLKSLR